MSLGQTLRWAMLAVLAAVIVIAEAPLNRATKSALVAVARAFDVSARWLAEHRGDPAAAPARGSAAAPLPLWSFTAENFEPLADPVVFADGTIVTSTRDAVIAFHADGRQRWRYAPPPAQAAYSRPLIDTRGELVLSRGHRLLRLSAHGAVVSDVAIAAPSEALGPPIPLDDGGLLLTATTSHALGARSRLIALDPHAAQRWEFDLATHRVSAVVPLAGGAAAVSIDGRVFHFAVDGRRTPAVGVFAHPRVPFALDEQGRVLHDLTDGAGWQAPSTSQLPAMPLPRDEVCGERMLERAADGTTLVPCLHGVYAFDAAGRELWRTELSFVAAFAFARGSDGAFYIVGDGLHALSADGRVRWHTKMSVPSPFAGAPVRLATPSTAPAPGPHDKLYLGSADNRVFALRADGVVDWIYVIGADSSASRAVTHLSWLNNALLVNAAGLVVLPIPGARLEVVTGERGEQL